MNLLLANVSALTNFSCRQGNLSWCASSTIWLGEFMLVPSNSEEIVTLANRHRHYFIEARMSLGESPALCAL